MIILILPPPIGYVHLYQAVNAIGTALRKTEWASVHCQYELKYQVDVNLDAIDDVLKTIAEACEAGTLAAAFQHLFKGADDLDRGVWRKPHWRNFFASGTTVVDQPLLIGSKPDPSGAMVPCERKIFIRKDSLGEFIALQARATAQPKGKGGRPRKFDHAAIAAEVQRLMDHHGEFSADDSEWDAQARLTDAIRKRFGEAAESTIEEYIKEPLVRWREQKAERPET